MLYTYQHNGQTYTLDITLQTDGQYRVSLGEHNLPMQVQPLPDGGWRLLWNGEMHTVYAASQGDQRFVQADGTTYTLTVSRPRSNRRKTTTTGDELTAQMPGQVTSVLAQNGDVASRGQTLLILEAMKMEIRVTAPTDGRVQQILVETGTVVERGQRLVIFEPTEQPAS